MAIRTLLRICAALAVTAMAIAGLVAAPAQAADGTGSITGFAFGMSPTVSSADINDTVTVHAFAEGVEPVFVGQFGCNCAGTEGLVAVNGSYTIEDLPPGNYTLLFVAGNFSKYAPVPRYEDRYSGDSPTFAGSSLVTAVADETVVAASVHLLEFATISGQVTTAAGEPIPAEMGPGDALSAVATNVVTGETVTSPGIPGGAPAGGYSVIGLKPGTYTVSIRDGQDRYQPASAVKGAATAFAVSYGTVVTEVNASVSLVGAKPPVVDPPAVDPPVVDPPAVDPPVVDPPVVDPPVVVAPLVVPIAKQQQGVGGIVYKKLRNGKKMRLAPASTGGAAITWRVLTPRTCKISKQKLVAKKLGKCKVTAALPETEQLLAVTIRYSIRVVRTL